MSARTVPSLSGWELAALRRKAGPTQTQLAQAVGISRHAVIYWEQKATLTTPPGMTYQMPMPSSSSAATTRR